MVLGILSLDYSQFSQRTSDGIRLPNSNFYFVAALSRTGPTASGWHMMLVMGVIPREGPCFVRGRLSRSLDMRIFRITPFYGAV